MTGDQPRSEAPDVAAGETAYATAGAAEEDLLTAVVDATNAGLLVVDGDTISFANGAVDRYLGLEPDELVGSSLGSVFPAAVTEQATQLPPEDSETFSLERSDHSLPDSLPMDELAVTLRRRPDADRVVVTMSGEDERPVSLRTFREAVDQAGHSIYVTDVYGTIQYVNPTFERTTGYSAEEAIGRNPAILNSGEHDDAFFEELWQTILDGEVWTGEVVNERKSGEQYVVNQTIAPIIDDSGAIDRFVAINDEITEQKRRERTLREQRNSLERIKQIIDSLRPINRDLARAGTREDIDRLVCERLAASEAYLFAWIGEYNAATDALTAREWAGVEADFVRDRDVDSFDGGGSFVRAVTERAVRAVQDVPTEPVDAHQRDRALTYGFQSQAAVPVVYGDTVLGVIGVYSARPDAFDEYERGLLRELGERVGHAINAAENKQLLHTDTVVELEFEVGRSASPVATVAADHECRLSLNDVTPGSGTDQVSYLEVDGAQPSTVVEAFAGCAAVSRARVVKARGETGVVELTGRLGPVATLVEHGATVRSCEATPEGATLRAETTPGSDVEPVIEDVQAHEGAVFVAKRTRDRDVRTLALTETAVEEALTDRQREAIALAYHAGYFASPRDSTGEELAEALGVSSPTFYSHVREGVRKILGLVVGDT